MAEDGLRGRPGYAVRHIEWDGFRLAEPHVAGTNLEWMEIQHRVTYIPSYVFVALKSVI